ncbi:uncharacterized protein TNCV_261721 [Trichonephila clavipes]|nr:uncharacterized protein TNCV_261721 [Trichonephila clavipes]
MVFGGVGHRTQAFRSGVRCKLQKVPSSGDDTKPGVRQSGSLEPSPSSPRRGQGRRSNRHRSAGSSFQRPGSPLAHILDTTTQPSLTTQRSRRFNDLWVRMDTYGKHVPSFIGMRCLVWNASRFAGGSSFSSSAREGVGDAFFSFHNSVILFLYVFPIELEQKSQKLHPDLHQPYPSPFHYHFDNHLHLTVNSNQNHRDSSALI